MPSCIGLLIFFMLAASAPAFAVVAANPAEHLIEKNPAPKAPGDFDPTSIEPASPALTPSAEPFSLETIPVLHGELLAKWRSIQDEMHAEHESLTLCQSKIRDCAEEEKQFLAIVGDGRAHEGLGRIGVINRDVNLAIIPRIESEWSSPLETLAHGSGDCKDYAIAKYAALREIGISAADIHILIVRNRRSSSEHAIVAVRIEQRWLILDNRWLALAEDMEVPNLIPIFELGEDGVKQFSIRDAAMVGARF